jgi:hypothetical protein
MFDERLRRVRSELQEPRRPRDARQDARQQGLKKYSKKNKKKKKMMPVARCLSRLFCWVKDYEKDNEKKEEASFAKVYPRQPAASRVEIEIQSRKAFEISA